MKSVQAIFTTIATVGSLTLVPVAHGSTAVGLDLGYRALSLRSDVNPMTFIQADIGSAWGYDNVAVGVDFCRQFSGSIESSSEPEFFYGIGAQTGAAGKDSAVALRLPLGLSWNIRDTRIQIGIAAVPELIFEKDSTSTGVAVSAPLRIRLN